MPCSPLAILETYHVHKLRGISARCGRAEGCLGQGGCGKSVGKGLVFKGEVIQASKKPFRLSPCTAVAVK